MEKAKLFFGGVPTDIDIRRLRDAFPAAKLSIGFFMSYDDVERAIDIKRSTPRFRTVTIRWRKLMEHEHGIIIGVRSGQGFSVFDDHQKHELSSSKLRSSGRSARRAISVASKVDRNLLSEQEKAEFDLNTFRAAAIAATAQMRKGLELPKF